MKKIVAINGSPRSGWNTDRLVRKAAEGAQSEGAETKIFDLYKLDKYTGCVSCFGCKLPQSEGRCIRKDALAPVLEAIRNADGLIIGTPNYLGDITAGARALYERLIFQALTYRTEKLCYNDIKIPVLFIMTSNTPEEYYDPAGYSRTLEGYKASLEHFIGDTKVMIAGNTLQVNDYSRFNWTMFDPEAKKEYHEKTFPDECGKAYSLGAEMIREPW